MSCFVVPKVDRLTVPTPDGDMWVDVKHRLNAGEYEDLFERWHDDKGTFKSSRVRRSRMVSYIVGWSLDQPFSDDAVKSLEMSVFRAIADAVEAHEDESDAQAAVKKTEQAGESDLSQSVPSANL
jgi:hypothetical protein